MWDVTQHQHNSNSQGDSQPQNRSLGRGWALPHRLGLEQPLMAFWGLQPAQVGHAPDVEEQHLSDAQQAGGDGEGKEGDAEEDVMRFVTATQREGRARHQEEATAQEPLQVIRASEDAQPYRQPTHSSPWAASTHLQEVEHKGSHPAPAVQAVHVGDAFGTVRLKDGHEACRKELISTGVGSPFTAPHPQHPPTSAMSSARPCSSACSALVERLASFLNTRYTRRADGEKAVSSGAVSMASPPPRNQHISLGPPIFLATPTSPWTPTSLGPPHPWTHPIHPGIPTSL